MARHHKSHKKHHSAHHESAGYFHGATGHHKDTEGAGRGEKGMFGAHYEHANLPTEVHMATYPNAYGDMPFGYYDDGMHGIDSQMKQDHETAMKQFMPRKGF